MRRYAGSEGRTAQGMFYLYATTSALEKMEKEVFLSRGLDESPRKQHKRGDDG